MTGLSEKDPLDHNWTLIEQAAADALGWEPEVVESVKRGERGYVMEDAWNTARKGAMLGFQAAREEPSQEGAGRFEAWLQTFEEDVVQTEYGYEPGEFTAYPDDWRQAWEDGLTPSAAFRRACEALTEARKADDALQAANALRIKAEDRAAVAEAKLSQEGAATPWTCAHITDQGQCVFGQRNWSQDCNPTRCAGCPASGGAALPETRGNGYVNEYD